jgi:hypothetical protein
MKYCSNCSIMFLYFRGGRGRKTIRMAENSDAYLDALAVHYR